MTNMFVLYLEKFPPISWSDRSKNIPSGTDEGASLILGKCDFSGTKKQQALGTAMGRPSRPSTTPWRGLENSSSASASTKAEGMRSADSKTRRPIRRRLAESSPNTPTTRPVRRRYRLGSGARGFCSCSEAITAVAETAPGKRRDRRWGEVSSTSWTVG